MAEYLLRHWLGPDSPWEVRSAGVAAPTGMPASEEAVAVLAEQGIAAAGHRSRPLDEGLVDAADRVVVMTANHRRIVLQRFPKARGKVFLLTSFGHAGRDEDIADPIGMPLEAYRDVRDEMNAVLPDLALHLHELLSGGQPGQPIERTLT